MALGHNRVQWQWTSFCAQPCDIYRYYLSVKAALALIAGKCQCCLENNAGQERVCRFASRTFLAYLCSITNSHNFVVVLNGYVSSKHNFHSSENVVISGLSMNDITTAMLFRWLLPVFSSGMVNCIAVKWIYFRKISWPPYPLFLHWMIWPWPVYIWVVIGLYLNSSSRFLWQNLPWTNKGMNSRYFTPEDKTLLWNNGQK